MEAIGLVPAYNEEENIAEVIKRLKKVGIQAVVIDDGSKDRTAEIAKKSGAILIKHSRNKGKAEAIKTGFDYVLKKNINYAVLIDADLQYLPEEARKLLKPLKEGKADFVTGYRNWKKVPKRHRLGNWVWRSFFNFLFGTDFKDTNCGYMALSRKSIEKLNKLYGGYILENTLFIRAIKNKLRIKQVPVTVIYKEKSTVWRGIRMVLGVLIFIVKSGIKFRLGLK